RDLGRHGLLHLQDELRLRPHVVGGRHARADRGVFVVTDAAAGSGARLDEDLVPALDERADPGRCEGDTLLAWLDLLRGADHHGAMVPEQTCQTRAVSVADDLDRHRYLSLATFRSSGAEVRTPVWFASFGGKLYVFSAGDAGKVKRLRRSSRARLAPCDARGT